MSQQDNLMPAQQHKLLLHCTQHVYLISSSCREWLNKLAWLSFVGSLQQFLWSPPSQMRWKDWGVSTMATRDCPALPSAATTVIHTMRKSVVSVRIKVMSAQFNRQINIGERKSMLLLTKELRGLFGYKIACSLAWIKRNI